MFDLPVQPLQGCAVKHKRVAVRIGGEIHDATALVREVACSGSGQSLEDVKNEWLCHSNRPWKKCSKILARNKDSKEEGDPHS
jgi:hypothetical protein